MDDFKKLLDKQMQKAQAASGTGGKAAEQRTTPISADAGAESPTGSAEKVRRGKPTVPAKMPTPSSKRPLPGSVPRSVNLNRVTVNLFDADRRALAVIKEMLGTAGHDFTNRSDSIKVALRIAAKAKREELAQIYEQVKAEDRRYRNAPE